MNGRTVSIGEALKNVKTNERATWNRSASSAARSERPLDASNRIFDGFARITPTYDGPRLKRGAPIFATGSGFARDIEKALTIRGGNIVSLDERIDHPAFSVKAGALRSVIFQRLTPFAILQEFQQAFGEAEGWNERSLLIEEGGEVLDLNYWDVGGLDRSLAATLARRKLTAELVRKVAEAEVVIVTLGLTESWLHKPSGFHANRVPTPTLVARRDEFELHLVSYEETLACLEGVRDLIARHRTTPFQMVVTVSPIPLAKTFTADDLIVANMNSKSLLRAAAAEFSTRAPATHYFPSYEMVLFSDQQIAWRPDRTHVDPPLVDHLVNAFVETYYEPGELPAKAIATLPAVALPPTAETTGRSLADVNLAMVRALGSVSDLLDSALVAGPQLATRAGALGSAPVAKRLPAVVPVSTVPAIRSREFGSSVAEIVTSKSDWLATHLLCPVCAASHFSPGGLTCLNCGTDTPLVSGVPNFITDTLAIDCRVVETDNVSAHAYSPNVLKILEKVVQNGGMALDCGAGSRTHLSEHLVQTDIAAYSNIDALAVNQALPFKDNSFDAVISLDVLEHVTDPFASARELARVLKPGGILFIDLPFLQPEHGYPHHYFNATRMGLRQLFDGILHPEVHGVPNSGHPSTVMMTMVRVYRAGLAKTLRGEFDELSVAHLVTSDFKAFRDGPFGTISDEILWKMPSTTQAVFSKAGERLLDLDPRSLPSFLNRPTFEG